MNTIIFRKLKKFLCKNLFAFALLILAFSILIMAIICFFRGGINIHDINVDLPEGIIGVIVGFFLSVIYANRKEKRDKEKLFKELRNELILNLGLLKKSLKEGQNEKLAQVQTFIFDKICSLTFLVGLPSSLQEVIRSTYMEIKSIREEAVKGQILITGIAEIKKKIEDTVEDLDHFIKHELE